MRLPLCALFGCLLVLGCASPSQPAKPSPYGSGPPSSTPLLEGVQVQDAHPSPETTDATGHSS
jgi:hypothetical protein